MQPRLVENELENAGDDRSGNWEDTGLDLCGLLMSLWRSVQVAGGLLVAAKSDCE